VIPSSSGAARGAVLGALAGDAAGATLEMLGRKPGKDEVKRALGMVGGGHWRTAPGQITDDGELSVCLLSALAGDSRFDVEKVARAYLRWVRSQPFDMGTTTHKGLAGGFAQPAGRVHEGMWSAAVVGNGASKANGGLMRVAPLGAWGHRLSEEALVEAAFQDSRLTHVHATCQHCSALYCLAIRHLVLHPGDAEGAFERARACAAELGAEEAGGWLEQAGRNEDAGYHPRAGFVKYGFVHAFRYLKMKSDYLRAVAETLLGGGDTDTNACIVGGMAGALHGEQGIPRHMVEALLSCNTGKGRPRPEFLQTRVVLQDLLASLAG
jgi:ADP-ribosylglycohydrolase